VNRYIQCWNSSTRLAVAALQPCITDLRRIQNTEYNESFWLETLARLAVVVDSIRTLLISKSLLKLTGGKPYYLPLMLKR